MIIFQKIEKEHLLPNSFYEARTTQITKSDKDITTKENYGKVPLIK